MIIKIKNIGKKYTKKWIFKELTYTFQSSQPYLITGPNGSGKSTLLQIIWGQLPPSTGRVTYHHQEKNIDPNDIYQFLSIATPYMHVPEKFTLEELIHFHFALKKVYHSIKLNDVSEYMGLSHVKSRQIGLFSSGMKQRVKLGLAFFADTPLLFLDEPCTNLDETSTEWYQKQLSEWGSNRTILIASNQENEKPPTYIHLSLLNII